MQIDINKCSTAACFVSRWNPDDPLDQQLVDSIRQRGLLVPIFVTLGDDGSAEIIDGYRRIMACKALGHTTISFITG